MSSVGWRSRGSSLGAVPAVRDLEDVAERVADHRSPIAIRGIEWRLQAHRSGVECPSIGVVRVVDIDVEKCGEQLTLAGSVTMMRESPTQISAGRLAWTVPVASNTARRKSTAAETLLTTMRGVTVWNPLGG
jgi:hypothetical protein